MSTTPNREKPHFVATSQKNAKLYLACFDSVRKHTQYWDKWIIDDCWIDIINERIDIPTHLKFVAADLNRAIGRNPKFNGLDTVGEPNVNGVFKSTYFDRGGGSKNIRLTAYYVTASNKIPQKPGGNTKWYRDIVSRVEPTRSTRQHPKRSVPIGSAPTQRTESAPKRKKREENINGSQPFQNDNHHSPFQNDNHHSPSNSPVALTELEAQVEANLDPIAQAIIDQSWWDTGDAVRYFGALDGELAAKETVEKRIEQLKKGYSNATGWKRTIDDFDHQELCSKHEIFNFQLKCRYVCLALRYAIDNMPDKTWLECCKDALETVNRIDGVDHITNERTLSRWHLVFRRNNESFPNPHVHSKDGQKTSLPPLLDRNPDLARSIIQYAKQNLNELCAELLYSYIHEIALPALLDERRAELANDTYTMEELLAENQLTKVSIPTIFRWMRRLGFKYEIR
jgi:hypothetical protein